MNLADRQNLANSFGWQDINAPVGISLVETRTVLSTVPGSKGTELTQRIWESLDNGQQFMTLDESEFMFEWDEKGQGFRHVSKWDVIHQLHFNSDTRLASTFLDSGAGLRPSLLDEIQELRRDVVFEELGHLPLSKRYHLDPELKAAVTQHWKRLEAQEEGTRRYNEAKFAQEGSTPPAISLDVFLSQPDNPTPFRVENLIPIGSTVTLVGARKAGKTTFMYNLLDSYLHGKLLLGAFEVQRVARRIGYVNMELTEDQARSWFRRSPIGSSAKVSIWNLRGMPNPFRSESSIKSFAEEMKALDIEVLILDPFSGIFTGGGKKSIDNDEVKEFLLTLEAFKASAGVSELLIPVHAGWDGSRSRGASALEDHPDTIMTIEADRKGIRVFSAIGRDVEIEAGVLDFNRATGELLYKAGAVRATKLEHLKEKMVKTVETNPGLNASELTTRVGGSKTDISEARQQLVSEGRLVETKGSKGKLSFSVPVVASSPALAVASSIPPSSVVASAYISGAYDEDGEPGFEYALSACVSHTYNVLETLGMNITICDDCYDVKEATARVSR